MPDLSVPINDAPAGLVAVTVACAYAQPRAAMLIGAVAGYLVIRGVELPGKLEIDDPVGAFLVYGIYGAQAFPAKRRRLGKRFW